MRRRDRQAKAIRKLLLEYLSVNGYCAGDKCVHLGTTERATEIDHVDGCEWNQRKVSSTERQFRFLDEWIAGVKLRAVCRSCNAKHLNNRRNK
jgi:hypothetical protein